MSTNTKEQPPPLCRNQSSLFPVLLPILAILGENPSVRMNEAIEWEKLLLKSRDDADLRDAYADWLQERSCHFREEEVRRDARRIRDDKQPLIWEPTDCRVANAPTGHDEIEVRFVRAGQLT